MSGNQPETTLPQKRPGRHAEANRKGPALLLEIARICAGESPKRQEFSLPQLPEEAYTKLAENLSRAEAIKFLDNLPVPLTSFTAGEGLFPESRILFVDDEHKRGWSTVLGALLFGRDDRIYDLNQNPEALNQHNTGLFVIDEIGDMLDADDISTLWRILKIDPETSRNHRLPFDLVLSDYRAKGEDPGLPPNQVSGTRIIRKIQEIDPSIPIIVVTASENFKTFRQLFLYGILGYYVKPYNLGFEETRQEYFNFCDLINYVKQNRYMRDLWNLVLWMEGPEAPRIRRFFLNDKITSQLADNCTPAPSSENLIDEQIMSCLRQWIGDAARFIYKRSRGLMFSKTIIDDDREISIFHTVEIFTWVLFRLSIISDSFYLSSRKEREYKDLLKDDKFFQLANEICKYIRNMTMHPGSFAPGEEDMFIMVLCLAKIAFADPIPPQQLTARLEEHSRKFPRFDFKTRTTAFLTACKQQNPERFSKLKETDTQLGLSTFLKICRKQKQTEPWMLHGTYLALLGHLLENDENCKQNQALMGFLYGVLDRF